MNLFIHNTRLIDPASNLDTLTSIYIQDGKIKAIGESLDALDNPEVLDANGCWTIPGLVDLCNRPHLKHPHGTTLIHEANIAADKGFAAICIPPDANPIIDNTSAIHHIQSDARKVKPALYPISALTLSLLGKELTDCTALIEAGSIAISQAQGPALRNDFLRSCYEYAASFDIPVIIQPNDPDLNRYGCAHDGAVASRLGLPGIPHTAETIAIHEHLALIELTGIKAHFSCLSSHHSVELIFQAKQKGLPISADVAMHSLILTEMDIMDFDGNCHLYPPLRSQRDQLGLIQGLQNGTIDAICSDHRPLDAMAKLAPFAETLPGLSAVDTFLSLGVDLVQKQQIDVMTLLRAMTCRPAEIFNLPYGSLKVGHEANLSIVDPNQHWPVSTRTLLSSGKNSPFLGWELPGVITHRILNGQIQSSKIKPLEATL